MNQNKNILRCTVFGVFAIALIAALLFSVSFLTCFDAPDSDYFKRGSFLPDFTVILVMLGILASTVLGIVYGKQEPTVQKDRTLSVRPFAFASLGFFVSAILICFEKTVPGWIPALLKKDEPSWLLPLFLILTGFACVNAVLSAGNKNRDNTARFLCIGILALVWFNCRFYFESATEMNSPIKVTLSVALLSSLVYYTSEIRFILGMDYPRLRLIFAFWTVLSGSLASFPILLAFIAGKTDRYDFLAASVLALCMMLTAGFRSAEILLSPKNTENTDTTDNTDNTDNTEESL